MLFQPDPVRSDVQTDAKDVSMNLVWRGENKSEEERNQMVAHVKNSLGNEWKIAPYRLKDFK